MAATIINSPVGGRSRHMTYTISPTTIPYPWESTGMVFGYAHKTVILGSMFSHCVVCISPTPDSLAECVAHDIIVYAYSSSGIELRARSGPGNTPPAEITLDVTMWDVSDDVAVALPMFYPRRGSLLDLLWTNPDPTANFAAQKINLDLQAYDYVVVATFVANTSEANRLTIYDSGRIPKGRTCVLRPSAPAGSTNLYFRDVTVVEDTGVTFATGYTNTTPATTVAIPMYIYGGRY